MNDAQSQLLSCYQPRQALIDGEILALPADLPAPKFATIQPTPEV